MSYWVSLESDHGPVPVAPHSEGGTYVVGGTPLAELNITYNYSDIYGRYGFCVRDLILRRAGDMVPRLEEIVNLCGTERADNYWLATPGNAGHALNVLLGWARANPDAVFRVS